MYFNTVYQRVDGRKHHYLLTLDVHAAPLEVGERVTLGGKKIFIARTI